MDRYKELEKRWLKYKIFSFIKVTSSFLILFVFIFFGYKYLGTQSSEEVTTPKIISKSLEDRTQEEEVNISKPQNPEVIEQTIETTKLEEETLSNHSSEKSNEESHIEKKNSCYRVVVGSLNVRSIPQRDGRVVDGLNRGEIICAIEEREDGWIKTHRGWSFSLGMLEEVNSDEREESKIIPQNIAPIEEIVEIESGLSFQKSTQSTQNTQSTQDEKSGKSINLTKEVMTKEEKIENIKERFSKNRKIEYALDIAQIYYESGNFAEAQKWALVANGIDSNDAKSWMIFAKIKHKEGKNQEAIKILERYLSKFYSKEAKNLLAEISNSNLR